MNPEVKHFLRRAPNFFLEELAQGWTVEATNGGHFRLTHESGVFVFCSATPSDRRAWHNQRSALRRARCK